MQEQKENFSETVESRELAGQKRLKRLNIYLVIPGRIPAAAQ
jgi:hypothetical protein